MTQPNQVTTTVEAELCAPVATAQRIRFDIHEGIDHTLRDEGIFWLDLCLTPRPPQARACYSERWGANRFERIGDLFFVPPGQNMHARSDGGTQTSMICRINPELMARSFDGELCWTEARARPMRPR